MAYPTWPDFHQRPAVNAAVPLAAGLGAGLISALPPAPALYAAWSTNLGIDSGRLQLLVAAALAVLVTALCAFATPYRGLGLVAGIGVVLAGVVAPSGLMGYNEAAPQGVTQTTDWARLVLNALSLGGAAFLMTALVPAAIAVAAQLKRFDARRLLVAAAVVGALPISAATAEPLIRYGPAYAVHHMSLAQGLQPASGRIAAYKVAPQCLGPSSLHKIEVGSQVLGQTRTVSVQLPAGYPGCAPGGGYTVLYLLHGDPGTYADWVHAGGKDLIDAAAAGGGSPLLVVYPDGNGPRWTDWADSGGWRIGTYVSQELVSYIDSHYQTSPHRDQLYIAGLSSGGFGAASLAMSHAQVFGGFASYSGYFNAGAHGTAHSAPGAASPDRLAASVDSSALHVFIGSGDADGLYTAEAQRFHALLQPKGWDVHYSETTGGHGWALWKALLWRSLPLVQQWGSFHPASSRGHQVAMPLTPGGRGQ